jgi:hypothetical protein
MTDQLERQSITMPTITTKIAIVVREDLAGWQKLNVTAFLASGIAATAPDSIGAPYRDADGTAYTPMFGQPVLVFTADADRMTGHDEANRAAVAALARADVDPVGLAVRADRKTVDKIVDGLRLHG